MARCVVNSGVNIYDLAIRVWLARRLVAGSYEGKSFIEAEMISDVSFGRDGGFWYSSYTWEDDNPVIHFKLNGKEGYIQIENMPPVKLIEECI